MSQHAILLALLLAAAVLGVLGVVLFIAGYAIAAGISLAGALVSILIAQVGDRNG